MDQGVYESVLTEHLSELLAGPDLAPDIAGIDPGDQPHVLARHVAAVVQRALETRRDPDDRLRLVNDVIAAIDQQDSVLPPAWRLRALSSVDKLLPTSPLVRPVTPLSEAALLTNARDEPSLAGELRAEMASANHVDLLCAFVRWHGVRLLEDAPARAPASVRCRSG